MQGARQTEAERLERQMHQSASERYADNHDDIAGLICLLREELRISRRQAAKHPNDWLARATTLTPLYCKKVGGVPRRM